MKIPKIKKGKIKKSPKWQNIQKMAKYKSEKMAKIRKNAKHSKIINPKKLA